MFQYAIGRSLANRLGTSLGVIFRGIHNEGGNLVSTKREYELAVFRVRIDRCLDKDSPAAFPGLVDRVMNRYPIIRNGILGSPIPYLTEKQPHVYDDSVAKLAKDSILIGYWQNPKYFSGVEQELRRDFVWVQPPPTSVDEVSRSILSHTSVAIHIRRGDYALEGDHHGAHASLPLSYYQRGLELISARVQEPFFYVFSDDYDWVAQHIELPVPYRIVNVNTGKNSHYDMMLMGQCDHIIMANSTFSWWSAWLMEPKGGIIVCPRTWYVSSERNNDARHLVREGWTVL